ncbi:class I lanthipeptide [Taibaiella chishuiensis]|uniref:Uncharacterized protein n=1 Tax=Taibaiella chishuiensis TaxID=1434707 RepID=A0A2P8CSN6_9BACT|nr:class I lanthipeptide [Taibaiella chishuiensis]PSK87974.1 hypothetical protein B0I18_1164 [Taibaiella chishuiensis]
MKKQRIALDKKLFLNKEPIVALNTQQQEAVAGGITGDVCKEQTLNYTCTMHSCGIACSVIFCV